MVALPLFTEPTTLAWSGYTTGVGPNPTGPGLLWYPADLGPAGAPDQPDTAPS